MLFIRPYTDNSKLIFNLENIIHKLPNPTPALRKQYTVHASNFCHAVCPIVLNYSLTHDCDCSLSRTINIYNKQFNIPANSKIYTIPISIRKENDIGWMIMVIFPYTHISTNIIGFMSKFENLKENYK